MPFIVCIKQKIPRPLGNKRKNKFYAGKKKRHRVKTQLTVNHREFIIHETGHKKRRRHEYDIYKED